VHETSWPMAGARVAFDARFRARIRARPCRHLHVDAVNNGAKARVDGMAGLGRSMGISLTMRPGCAQNKSRRSHMKHRLLDVMRHEEYALYRQLPRRPQVEKVIAQRFGRKHIERRKRLIHEKNIGMHHECARGTLLFGASARKLTRISGLESIEADEVDGGEGAAAESR